MFRREDGGCGAAALGAGRRVLTAVASVAAFAGAALGQLEPCAPDPACIVVAASSPPGVFSPGEEVPVSITFRSAADDGEEGGADEIAAVSLSLSIPGLDLADCAGADGDGLTAAFSVPAAVAQSFFVFVENTSCSSRSDCLCPGEGQGRDSFVNVVLTPKSVFDPEPPPLVPVLPNGELLSVRLRVRPDAPSTVRLHVFSAVDDPAQVTKPDFAGLVTVGDRHAVDQTADRKSNTSKIRLIDGQVLVAGAATPTATLSPTATASATFSPTAGPSPTATETATVTPSVDPEATPTATAAASATPSGTASATASATASPTVVPDDTPTDTPVPPATVTPTVSPQSECPGDCDGDGVVRIDELVRAVAISLGGEDAGTCAAADRDADGVVTVDELVRAVGAALAGCGRDSA